MTQPKEQGKPYDRERRESLERIQEIGIDALLNAYDTHNTLGKDGLAVVHTNDHGDTALRADLACEGAVLDVLRQKDLPIVVYSEEHGVVTDIGKQQKKYLGVLDGIDGTARYKDQFGTGPYATLFGIYDTADPMYNDSLFSGIMQHAKKRLFYAIKGQGAFVRNLEDGTTQRLPRIDTTPKDDPKWKKLYAETDLDPYLGLSLVADMMKKLPDFDIHPGFTASVACYVGLLTGERGAFLDGTRKLNLEMAAIHGLVKELGGAVMMLDGRTIGDQKYLTFGQGDNHIPIVTAASNSFGSHLVKKIAQA